MSKAGASGFSPLPTGGSLVGMVKAWDSSLERTDGSSASAITEKTPCCKKSSEKTHISFNNVFHLITRALKRTVGSASLKAGKQG
jgi:hypothetical protein